MSRAAGSTTSPPRAISGSRESGSIAIARAKILRLRHGGSSVLLTFQQRSRNCGAAVPDIDIRDATPDDAQGIVGVLNPIIEAGIYTILDAPFTAEAERDFIRTRPSRGVFLVAVDRASGAIVGFQNTQPLVTYTHACDHVGEMGTYVDLSRRREGIASRLFQESFVRALSRGYEKIFTLVRGDNQAALHTYLHHGFQIVGTAQRHARVCGRYIDETLIERFLKT
jgi:L-amino acid N-acyltransferase YncA